jgi:hypothetical protein
LNALRKRFTKIPIEIEIAIREMNDPIALESLIFEAFESQTLDEFATALN